MLGLRIATLALSILSVWGQLAVIALALEPMAGRAAATRTATARLLPVLGNAILVFVAAMVLLAPIPLVLVANGFDLTAAMAGVQQEMPQGTPMLFISLYTLVVLIALLWFGARLALLYAVVVGERPGMRAIPRAFTLTARLVWRIIGILLLFLLVSWVATLAAKTVFGSILRLVAGGDGPVSVASVLTSIIVGAVTTGFVVLAAAFSAKLYLAVRDGPGAIAAPA